MTFHHLVGQRFGPGPEIVVDRDSVNDFCLAIGVVPTAHVPLLLVASLLPALGVGIEIPLPEARATINYGLNRLEQVDEVQIGDALQATFFVEAIEDIGPALQIFRTAEISAKNRLVVRAETLTRVLF